MATRSKEIQLEIADMKRRNIPDSVIEQVMRERRNQVESEIYRFNSSERKIEALRKCIEDETEKMCSIGSPVLSDMPKGPHNPQAGENRLINSIDKIIAWEREINAEKSKNERFCSAFNVLPEHYKTILKHSFGLFNAELLSIHGLINKSGYGRSQTFFMRLDALDVIAFRLLGPVSVTHPLLDSEAKTDETAQ